MNLFSAISKQEPRTLYLCILALSSLNAHASFQQPSLFDTSSRDETNHDLSFQQQQVIAIFLGIKSTYSIPRTYGWILRGIPPFPRAINNALFFSSAMQRYLRVDFHLFYLLYTHTEQYPIPNDDLFRLLLLSLFIRIIQAIHLTAMPSSIPSFTNSRFGISRGYLLL